ncbi:MAG TPA: hypothetical protein VND91_06340 [Candidatus Saccharimonadia bacterium]|nr:hypothetical protein [Candidatus Saccharimonadia bacterium]
MDPAPERPATALFVLALASAAASVAAMVWFGQSAGALASWFTLWVLSPPIVALALAKWMPGRFRTWPPLALAGLALLFGPVVYAGVALGPADAQNALVFAIAPFWQLLALGVAWLAAIALNAWAARHP